MKKSRIDVSSKIKFLGHKFLSDKKGVMAFESDTNLNTAYHTWYSHKPHNNRRRVDLLSDGILRQKDFSILFDTEIEDKVIPSISTNIINIYSNVIFDVGFLDVSMKNGIIVNIFDKKDVCLGSFIPSSPLKAPIVTHEQLVKYYNKECRIQLAKEFIIASIHNSLLNIRYYNKQHNRVEYEDAIEKLCALKKTIKLVSEYEKLLLLEAQARSIYYGCFDHFIQGAGFVFEGRTRRPPKNNVNAIISFGNTVLYSLIATEIQKTTLDVRIGFLHATNSRKASLNLDIAEIFKPLVVDRVIFSLINKRSLSSEHFTYCENGAVYLNEEGKHIFFACVL